MKTNVVALIAVALPVWGAGITVYPPSIQLTGRNASQVVAVSSGETDITADCTFQVTRAGIALVSKEGVVTAAGDGRRGPSR